MELLDNLLANKARCSCNENLHSRTSSDAIVRQPACQPFAPSLHGSAAAVLRLLRHSVKLRQFTTDQLDQGPHRLAAEFEATAGPGEQLRQSSRASQLQSPPVVVQCPGLVLF